MRNATKVANSMMLAFEQLPCVCSFQLRSPTLGENSLHEINQQCGNRRTRQEYRQMVSKNVKENCPQRKDDKEEDEAVLLPPQLPPQSLSLPAKLPRCSLEQVTLVLQGIQSRFAFGERDHVVPHHAHGMFHIRLKSCEAITWSFSCHIYPGFHG